MRSKGRVLEQMVETVLQALDGVGGSPRRNHSRKPADPVTMDHGPGVGKAKPEQFHKDGVRVWGFPPSLAPRDWLVSG